jgi:hypothetical protein
MYYWNQKNYEGLNSLASEFPAQSYLEHLVAYCELREKGLRRQAFAQLDAFLKSVSSLEIGVQRELALQIIEAHWKTPEAHQFLSYPLSQFLVRVLEDWRAAEVANFVPLRYLALLRNDRSLLLEAFRLNPKDGLIRTTYARNLIESIDYATHHLIEGQFIGDEEEASAELIAAAAVLEGVADTALAESLKERLQGLSALLADWREYKQAPKGSFPEYCRERNHHHKWWNIYYYDA